ncbi:putative nuclease HARBI1 [Lucilia cuprina]|nr:putative nuclease HARBI1 [Lucilia cuprina]
MFKIHYGEVYIRFGTAEYSTLTCFFFLDLKYEWFKGQQSFKGLQEAVDSILANSEDEEIDMVIKPPNPSELTDDEEEVLESSSSSDDEEDEIYALLGQRNYIPRVKCFVDNRAIFKKTFVLAVEVPCILLRDTPHFFLKDRTKAEGASYLLRHRFCHFCEVGNLFGMSLSTIHNSFNNVLDFIITDLAPEVIKFPQTIEEKEIVSKEFEKIAGFPNILGCIDGSYISIRTPKYKIRSTYANRHDGVSITLQGICDAKLRFLDVFTGIPSNIHDSRILKLSFIGKDLQSLCSPKYHLLGDSAYPIREFLMTPFRDYGNLSESEKNYNLKFCRTRGRFRQLMRLDFHNVDTMAKFIIACCVLHNICINKDDFYDEELSNNEYEFNNQPFDEDTRDNLLTQLGQIKRNDIKNHLFNSTT